MQPVIFPAPALEENCRIIIYRQRIILWVTEMDSNYLDLSSKRFKTADPYVTAVLTIIVSSFGVAQLDPVIVVVGASIAFLLVAVVAPFLPFRPLLFFCLSIGMAVALLVANYYVPHWNGWWRNLEVPTQNLILSFSVATCIALVLESAQLHKKNILPKLIAARVSDISDRLIFFKRNHDYRIKLERDAGTVRLSTEYEFQIENRWPTYRESQFTISSASDGHIETISIEIDGMELEEEKLIRTRGKVLFSLGVATMRGRTVRVKMGEIMPATGSEFYTTYLPSESMSVIVSFNSNELNVRASVLSSSEVKIESQGLDGEQHKCFKFGAGVLPYEGVRIFWAPA